MALDYADLLWDHDKTAQVRFIEELAPIVLFTYNRLDHTRQTVKALQNNVYAKESRLFIFSDAPKTETAVAAVQEVRNYLRTIAGFKEVRIIEREENWGLARNIMNGVTDIVNAYGKIIVLEDDIVTSTYFLKYMNDALEVYKHSPRVMNISAYVYPMKKTDLPETFFTRAGYCWGWGTWKGAWTAFERDPEKLMNEFTREDIYHFNFEGRTDFWQQVLDNRTGKLYTWAVFWDAAIFKNHGLTLVPRDSLVVNIGMDGTGEHCSLTDIYHTSIATVPVRNFPLLIAESTLGRERHQLFFAGTQKSLVHRVLARVKNAIQKFL